MYQESNIIELKEKFVDKIKQEIIEFLNSDGWVIYACVTLDEVLSGRQSIRNPRLINVLDKLSMIENYRTGLQRAIESYDNFEFKPIIRETQNFFTVILPNINYYLNKVIQDDQETTKNNKQTTQEIIIIDMIRKNPKVTRKELAMIMNLTEDRVKYHLDKLRKSKKIKRVGSTKSGQWIIL